MYAASFIIINYNGKKFLPKLISSIQSQDNDSFEIIIVDNGSTDNSCNYITKHFPTVTLISSTNLGYGLGCNLGADHAKGKFLIFLNPDTFVPSNFLSKYLSFYNQKVSQGINNIGCLNCRVVDYSSKTTKSRDCGGGVVDIFGTPQETVNKSLVEDSFFVFGTALFIKRQLFLEIGGFNPNIFLYGEEIDLCWRLKIYGYRHIIDNQNFFYHYGGGSFGSNHPNQTALMTYGCFICTITNYQTSTLAIVLPFYAIYLISLFLILPFFTKFNLKYNYQLLKVFSNLTKDYKNIVRFRKIVQKSRTINDIMLVKFYRVIPSILTRLLSH